MKNHSSMYASENNINRSGNVLINPSADWKIWNHTWTCLSQDVYLHLWSHLITLDSSMNMWGFFLCLLFLTYTLLEVPKALWNVIKYSFLLNISHFRGRGKKCIETADFSVNSGHSLICHVQRILQKMHIHLQERKNCCYIHDDIHTSALSATTLIHLNRQVIKALQTVHCPVTRWERLVAKMQVLEDKFSNRQSSDKYYKPSSHQLNHICVNNNIGIEFWPFIQTSSCSELQSPVNICTRDVTRRPFAPLIFTDFMGKEGHAYLSNMNQSATVTLEGQTLFLEGGPLRGSYKFAQLHFHWSLDNNVGSEHTLDGKSFAMESHAVYIHIRCEDVAQALECVNGIAVVANFLQITDRENQDFLPISNNLKKIRAFNSVTEIPIDCFSWMKNNGHYGYFTYPGSLTTPLESKTVTWILFPEPIAISVSQINGFRELLDAEEQQIQQNCRNVQDLNDREIFFAL